MVVRIDTIFMRKMYLSLLRIDAHRIKTFKKQKDLFFDSATMIDNFETTSHGSSDIANLVLVLENGI